MIKCIEEHHIKNDNRNFFKDAKEIQNGFVPREVNCKDEIGNIISEKDKILQRWKDYFETILKNHTTGNLVHIEACREEEEEAILEPSYKQMRETIKKLKNNKAPGSDEIVGELLK
jgi:hypothetical protein